MRRFLYWQLPLAASMIAVAVFSWGFIAYLRGDTGLPVKTPSAAENMPAPGASLAPIIVGDSLARGAGDPTGLGIGGRLDAELRQRRMAARRTWNVAVNGARTSDLLELLSRPNVQRLIGESNVVIVSIGGNDLWGRNDWRTSIPPNPDEVIASVLDRVEQIVEKIREISPKARIVFVGLYNPFIGTPSGTTLTPLVNRWNGHLLDRFGGDNDFTLVQTSDLFSHRDRLALDRFHPGAEAYALIARRIAEGL